MTRNYEIAVIFHPDLDDDRLATQVERVEGLVAADDGSIVSTNRWGKRRLAYEIRKKREGFYYFWYAALPASAPQEIERNLRLNEEVMRFMLTRVDAFPHVEEKQEPEAQAEDPAADVEVAKEAVPEESVTAVEVGEEAAPEEPAVAVEAGEDPPAEEAVADVEAGEVAAPTEDSDAGEESSESEEEPDAEEASKQIVKDRGSPLKIRGPQVS